MWILAFRLRRWVLKGWLIAIMGIAGRSAGVTGEKLGRLYLIKHWYLGSRSGLSVIGVICLVMGCTAGDGLRPDVDEGRPDITAMSAPDLVRDIAEGRLGAEQVTLAFLERIATLDEQGPAINAIAELNPDALRIASDLDRAYEQQGVIGPLHGLPVIIKDNIDTGDQTQARAGSVALNGHIAFADAHLVTRLRQAGAVILAKANLSEWANFRGSPSTSGWSSTGGQIRNPYVLDRNPCGSSGGSAVAVAAAFAPLAVGTETNGSIVCPSGVNGIVGIKPTVGTVSRAGVIPVAMSFDTAGPMATTVAGAALMLETLVDYDQQDAGARSHPNFSGFMPKPDVLDLAHIRIGVVRNYGGAGVNPKVGWIYDGVVTTLTDAGAHLVDPVESPLTPAIRTAAFEVMKIEIKHGLAEYMATHGYPNDLKGLDDLIAFNIEHAETVMPVFGQELFVASAAMPPVSNERYETALHNSVEMLRDGFDRLLADRKLDLVIAPVNGPAWKTDWVAGDRFQVGTSSLAAITGYPSVVVPAGHVSGLPIGVAFIGPAFSEAKLIQVAYVFEQLTKARRPPEFLPTLEEVLLD
jgi:amidase